MTLDTLFLACNASVLPCWLLLAVAPGWRATQVIVHSALVPLLLGALYVVLLLGSEPLTGGAGFGSLPAVMKVFAQPQWVVVGWVHYLVFDLFVGAWEARDALRLGIHPVAVAPCLLLTFMLGPSGLLCYLILRVAWKRSVSLDETAGPAEAPAPGS